MSDTMSLITGSQKWPMERFRFSVATPHSEPDKMGSAEEEVKLVSSQILHNPLLNPVKLLLKSGRIP